MKLDRNKNPDGKGKYALINLRTNTIQWGGGEPGEQFFVLKYKDKFAHFALTAYADAVAREASSLKSDDPMQRELLEFAAEIQAEAQAAWMAQSKLPD